MRIRCHGNALYCCLRGARARGASYVTESKICRFAFSSDCGAARRHDRRGGRLSGGRCAAGEAPIRELACRLPCAQFATRDVHLRQARHLSISGSPDANWTDLRRSYRQEFSTAAKAQWSPSFERVEASGNLAVAFSKWRLLEPDRSGRQTVKVTNNSVDVFGRDNACQWKIFRSMTYRLK